MVVVRTLLASLLLAVVPGLAAADTCNLNADGPDTLRMLVAQSGSDFDLGWKGDYHDLQVPGGATFELCLSGCDTTTDPVCDVSGYAGGQSAAGRSFAPPIPVVIGGTAVCVATTFEEPFATGTANVETGAVDVVANISADVYLTTSSAVCPTCSGSAAGETGTCQGGANAGAACTTGEVITVSGATGNPYRVSRDCLPSGAPLSTTFSVAVTTGTSTRSTTCTGQTGDDDCGAGSCGSGNCTGSGSGGIAQNCCTTATSQRCFPYPLTRTGTVAAPAPGWPDPTYPKLDAATLVSTFCAPAVPGLLGIAVNSDVGLPGPATFILPVAAEWELDPTPTSTTTTTVVTTSTTTTTTLGCTSGAECADGEACTDDVCTDGTCSNPQLGGAAGVDCALGEVDGAAVCSPALDTKTQSALASAIAKARTAVQKTAGAPAKKVKKYRTAADKALKAFLKKLGKAEKKGAVTGDCAGQVRQLVESLRAAVRTL